MGKFVSQDGIARWKIDSPIERFLGKKADNSFFWKKMYVHYYQLFDKPYYDNGLKFIAQKIEIFCGKTVVENKTLYNKYVVDMTYSLHRFGCMFDEYFLYDFYHKNTQGRLEYITDKIRYDYYAKFNGYDYLSLFNDKLKTYELFKDFYSRRVIGIYKISDKQELYNHFSDDERVIVKPINSSGGRGVQILYVYELKVDVLLEKYPDGIVVEEILDNHAEFMQFNKSSLNTVRIVTIRLNDRVVIPFAIARFGRKGSCTDNGYGGGVLATIDIDTGVITCARDEMGREYIYHPDSEKLMIGFRIPCWKELKEQIKAMTGIVPDNRYIGWDMAYTDGKKWVMIEANPRGQFLSQYSSGKGIKKEIDSFVGELQCPTDKNNC